MRRPNHRAFVLGLLLTHGCDRDRPASVAPETSSTPAPVSLSDAISTHIGYLADDAQEGRAPGTEADGRVQDYIEGEMKAMGLRPGFGASYRQSFSVADGVRVHEGMQTELVVGGAAVPHSIVPFSADTSVSGTVRADLVFVGYGLTSDGVGTGDYADLETDVKGQIVVALDGGPSDPHLGPAKLRPQSKLITARDHGAAGFVLWDPRTDVGIPNRGEANDLELPALFVGKSGNAALLAGFGKPADASTSVEDGFIAGLGPGDRAPGAGIATPVARVQVDTANVAGLLPGSGGDGAPILVLGAHMDHLGWGTASSLSPDEHAIHNGADDNASGVAVVLEVCRALAELPPQSRTDDVLCMAFGAEEMGLLGSKAYVAKGPPEQVERIAAMINLDMVGRLRPDVGLTVSGSGTSSVWPKLIEAHRGALSVKLETGGYGPSDHASFYEAGKPVLHLFTGAHDDYHKPSDDVGAINVEGAVQVTEFVRDLMSDVLESRVTFDYVETNRPSGPQRRFKVSLGTIPDYGADVEGVRLSGVRDGSPAEQAGLRAGDVVKRIGAREIHNFDDFMATFGELEPGVSVPVVVVRDGATLDLELVPAAPKPRP